MPEITGRTILKGTDHTAVARQALDQLFKTEGGRQGLWGANGELWAWNGSRWANRPRTEIERTLIEWVEDAWVLTDVDEGGQGTYSRATSELSGRDIREVMWVLERMAQAQVQSVPRWLEAGDWPDPDHCIAFQDVVLDVRGSTALRAAGRSDYVVYPRDDRFFGPGVLTVPFAPGGACPTWLACQDQWSNGDALWQEVRERAYGYACMATRKYGKALLEYGKSQSGKGSGTNSVLSKLLLAPAYHSATVDQVIEGHGMDGLHLAQVWIVPEVRDMDRGAGAKFSTILKVVLGGDASMVNIKFVRQLKGVRFKAFPMMQANAMPTMPDDAGSVSSKLIVLPFTNSFADRRDEDLPFKLATELPGIAARFAEAAVRLEMAPAGEKWPVVSGAAEILAHMALDGNIFDAFLKWAFIKTEGNTPVSEDYVMAKRAAFEHDIGLQLRRRDGRRIPDSQLLFYLETASSWRVNRVRLTSGGMGLRGIQLRSIV